MTRTAISSTTEWREKEMRALERQAFAEARREAFKHAFHVYQNDLRNEMEDADIKLAKEIELIRDASNGFADALGMEPLNPPSSQEK